MTRTYEEWVELIEGERFNIFDLLPTGLNGVSIEDFVGAMGNAVERSDIQIMKAEGLKPDQILVQVSNLIYSRLGWEEQEVHRALFSCPVGLQLEKIIVKTITSFL